MKEAMGRYREYMLCKLTQEDVAATRALYEDIFREDSKAFVDYYYKRKAPHNVILVLETESGEIISMLHMTPYTLCVRGDGKFVQMPTCYVYAVATKEKYRGQGCMAKLLEAAERHCIEKKIPYLFLMPAAAAIYEPFGYRFCYERPEFYVNYKADELPRHVEIVDVGALTDGGKRYAELCTDYGDGSRYRQNKRNREDILDALVQFTNTWLMTNTDFFLKRSLRYYVNLMAELRAQNGSMYVFLLDGRIAGYYCQTGEDNQNMGCGRDCIQEAMLSDEIITAFLRNHMEAPILVSDEKTPVIMGRIMRPVWESYVLKQGSLGVGLGQNGWITELA